MEQGKSKGLNIIDLIIALIIVIIIILFTMPMVIRPDESLPLSTKCLSHLSQIGKAIQAYTDDNNGYYPIGPSYYYRGKVKIRLDRVWTPEFIGGAEKGTAEDAPHVADRPLYKYTSGNLAMWRCPAEEKQDNGPNLPFDKPSSVWGTTYIFNGVYAWDGSWPKSHRNPPAFYTLMGKGWANRPAATRKCTDVLHPSKLWMAGERTMYYYWCRKRSQIPPAGHMGKKPFSPVVFCDGHTGTIYLESDNLVNPNGRWGFIEQGWHPDPKYAKYGL